MGRPRQPGKPSYEAVHARISVGLGPASAHQCPCGARAMDWAYDGLDENEHSGRTAAGYLAVYSSNLDHYAAMCRSCHRKMDSDKRKGQPRRRILIKKLPSAAR